MSEFQHLCHPHAPVFDENCRLLILGSFPSVRSRQTGFYYGHPQNRFWPVLATVYEAPRPQTIEEKRALLLTHHIALWDVIASCEICGSSDASIRNVVPNDVSQLLSRAPIGCILVNGGTAARLYDRYLRPTLGMEAVRLPSTSPANASWSLNALCRTWKCALCP